MNNILVIAAHPDDELLGVGATVRKLTDEGKTVRAVIMAEGITSRAETRDKADGSMLEELRTEARRAAEITGYNITSANKTRQIS